MASTRWSPPFDVYNYHHHQLDNRVNSSSMTSRRKQARPIRMQDDDEVMASDLRVMRRPSESGEMTRATGGAGREAEEGHGGDGGDFGEKMVDGSDSRSAASEDDVLVPDTENSASYPEPLPIEVAAAPPQSPLHLHSLLPAQFSATHVTLEALENTKVAVAQFAATALANGADAASLKDLARLQLTLHTLQHQQMFQINLIHELQSKVAGNEEAQQRAAESAEQFKEPPPEVELPSVASVEQSEEAIDFCHENKTPSPPPQSQSPPHVYEPQPSPESSVITNHDSHLALDHFQPDSLEMLRRGAQEALDTASQGLLSGNLVDELTRRREESSDEFKTELLQKHRCRYCGKVFGSDSALQIHLRSHTGERPFCCQICGTRFTTKGNLKVHFQRHLDERPFVNGSAEWDPMPRAATSSDTSFWSGHQSGPFSGAMMVDPADFKGNEPMEISQPRQCPICFQTCPCLKTLQVHILSHQTDSMPVRPTEIAPMVSVGVQEENIVKKAEPRSRRRDNKRDNRRSSSKRSTPKPSTPEASVIVDEAKSVKISPPVSFGDHYAPLDLTANAKPLEDTKLELASPTIDQPAHPMFAQGDPFNRQPNISVMNGMRCSTTCNVCYKTFACYSALEIHYRSHTKERPFKCKVCDRCFSTKGNMKQHFMTHKLRGDPGYVEDDGSQSASTPDSVGSSSKEGVKESSSVVVAQQMEHQANPVDEPHPNDEANEFFKAYHAVSPQSEMSISPNDNFSHNSHKADDDPFRMAPLQNPFTSDALPFNQDTFRAFEELRNQTAMPAAADPSSSVGVASSSSCNEAGSSASTASSANNKHWCNICRRHFSSSSALQIHGRTHTGDRPFSCTVCQKSFTTKGNLKVHMSTHMWTHGASRRGRRMSLEMPALSAMQSAPAMSPRDSEFMQRRPDLFYPYHIPAALMGRLFPKY